MAFKPWKRYALPLLIAVVLSLQLLILYANFLAIASARYALKYEVETYFLLANGSSTKPPIEASGLMTVSVVSASPTRTNVLVHLDLDFVNSTERYCKLVFSSGMPSIRCSAINYLPASLLRKAVNRKSVHVELTLVVIIDNERNYCYVNGTNVGFCPFYVAPYILLNESSLKWLRRLVFLGIPISCIDIAHYSQVVPGKLVTVTTPLKNIVEGVGREITLPTLEICNKFADIYIRSHYVVAALFILPTRIVLGRYVELLPKPLRNGITYIEFSPTRDTLLYLASVKYPIPPYLETVTLPGGIVKTVIPSVSNPVTVGSSIASSSSTLYRASSPISGYETLTNSVSRSAKTFSEFSTYVIAIVIAVGIGIGVGLAIKKKVVR